MQKSTRYIYSPHLYGIGASRATTQLASSTAVLDNNFPLKFPFFSIFPDLHFLRSHGKTTIFNCQCNRAFWFIANISPHLFKLPRLCSRYAVASSPSRENLNNNRKTPQQRPSVTQNQPNYCFFTGMLPNIHERPSNTILRGELVAPIMHGVLLFSNRVYRLLLMPWRPPDSVAEETRATIGMQQWSRYSAG